MKKTLLILGALLGATTIILGAYTAYAGPTDGVLGCWRTVDEKTNKVKSLVCFTLDKKTGIMSGTIKKLFNPKTPNPKCEKCPGARKNKPILGMVIVWNMKKGDDSWEGGRILDPEKGKDYRCRIWREGEKLMVRGYWAIFYRTQTWIK